MKLATVCGIRFGVNPLFLVLLVTLAWVGRLPEALIVFGIVLLHEIGHVAAARGYGVAVSGVELLPFGGVARMEGLIGADPGVEAGIALAGPLTNGMLIGVGALLWRHQVLADEWARLFIAANVTVATLNLLPALPLDGGRLYRAYRSRRVGYRRATAEAARLGRALGAACAVAGGFGAYLGYVNLTLPVLGLFVFVAAGREETASAYVFMAYLDSKRRELDQQGCLESRCLVVRIDTPVKQVLERFVPKKYHVVWVVDEDGRPAGVAFEAAILDAAFDRGLDVPMGSIARRTFIDMR
ncbi:MAG: CBS domain-containing protein [Firmicutes bacterium]|nr:CBS domain-containing protein [Bacillota bacterium]